MQNLPTKNENNNMFFFSKPKVVVCYLLVLFVVFLVLHPQNLRGEHPRSLITIAAFKCVSLLDETQMLMSKLMTSSSSFLTTSLQHRWTTFSSLILRTSYYCKELVKVSNSTAFIDFPPQCITWMNTVQNNIDEFSKYGGLHKLHAFSNEIQEKTNHLAMSVRRHLSCMGLEHESFQSTDSSTLSELFIIHISLFLLFLLSLLGHDRFFTSTK